MTAFSGGQIAHRVGTRFPARKVSDCQIYRLPSDSHMSKIHDAIRKWMFEGADVAEKEIRQLAAASPELLNKPDDNGEPPVFLACAMMRDEPLRLLVELGADVNARNGADWPLFLVAAANVSRDVLALLVEKGADPLVVADDGQTALHRAMLNERTAIGNAEFLLEKGADINARDQMGWNALDKAALDNLVEATKFLLSKGAEANHVDGRGMTAQQVAKERGYDEVVALLAAAG